MSQRRHSHPDSLTVLTLAIPPSAPGHLCTDLACITHTSASCSRRASPLSSCVIQIHHVNKNDAEPSASMRRVRFSPTMRQSAR